MNVNDEIWRQMKRDAIAWAASGRPTPSIEECVEHIGRIAETTLPQNWSLPIEARGFYAAEFRAMIKMRRAVVPQNVGV